MTRPLHALTLWPEWAWAIAYLPEPLAKRCENRTWTPSPKQLQPGDWLAIHAGAIACSRFGTVWSERLNAMTRAAWEEQKRVARASGGKLERCRLLHHFTNEIGGCLQLDGVELVTPAASIIAVARVTGWDQDQRTAWDVLGQWHWRLDDVRVLDEPVPCKGRQGLWRPHPDDAQTAIVRAGLDYLRTDATGRTLNDLEGLQSEKDTVRVSRTCGTCIHDWNEDACDDDADRRDDHCATCNQSWDPWSKWEPS